MREGAECATFRSCVPGLPCVRSIWILILDIEHIGLPLHVVQRYGRVWITVGGEGMSLVVVVRHCESFDRE